MGRRAAILLVAAAVLGSGTPTATADTQLLPPLGVHSLGPTPAGVRPTVLVHAGNRVLLFGVDAKAPPSRNAGAVYSVPRGRWRSMARAPFDSVVQLPVGVWSGHELVVVGLACDAGKFDDEGGCRAGSYVGGAYEPRRDRWRTIPIPDAMAADADAGSTIGEPSAVGWSAGRAVFLVGSGFWAFEPDRERWERLPDAATYSCATKRSLVSLVGITLSVLERGARSWHDASPLPAGDAAGPFFLACADDAVYVHPQVLSATWRYDLASKRWDTLPPPPSPPALTRGSVWTGRELLVGILIRSPDRFETSSDGFLFDPATGTWRTTEQVIGLEGQASWGAGYAYTLGYDELRRATLLQTYRPRGDG